MGLSGIDPTGRNPRIGSGRHLIVHGCVRDRLHPPSIEIFIRLKRYINLPPHRPSRSTQKKPVLTAETKLQKYNGAIGTIRAIGKTQPSFHAQTKFLSKFSDGICTYIDRNGAISLLRTTSNSINRHFEEGDQRTFPEYSRSEIRKQKQKEVNMRVDDMRRVPDQDQRRNCLTVRLRDREHQALSDEAWRNRMTMSGWVRQIALSHLKDSKEAGATIG